MKIKINLISILLFLYSFLVCTNQLFQVVGIPIFIIPLLILLVLLMIKRLSNELHFKNTTFFLICWLMLSILLSIYVNNTLSWRNTLFVFINISGFLVISEMSTNEDRINMLVKGFICGTTINILICFWELNTGNHIVPLTMDYLRRFSYYPLGFYPNSNDLSCFLISMIPIILINYENCCKRKLLKILNILLLVSLAFIVIKTRSVIGIVAMILMPMGILIFKDLKNRKGKIRLLLSVLISIVFCVLFSNFLYVSFFSLEINTMFIERFQLWNNALNLWSKSMIFGIGPGQNALLNYGLVHNYFIEVLSEYGIFIFAGVIYLFIKILKDKFKNSYTWIGYAGLIFLCELPVLSISTSSLTKIFSIWSAIALIYAFNDKKNKTTGEDV